MAATDTPAPTGNPILDDPDSGQQTFTHPGASNPITSDQSVGNASSPPGFLSRAWTSIQNLPETVTRDLTPTVNVPGSAPPAPPPALAQPDLPIKSGLVPGIVRGVRDFWDKTIEAPNPEYGYTPSDADLAQVRQQNAADRAQAEKDWAGDPGFTAGRIFGNVVGTAPVMGPLSTAVGTGVRALPVIGAAADMRGLLGIGARGVERGLQGGVGGGAAAGLLYDPSQPVGPQVAQGAEVGAGLGIGGGFISDLVSNVSKRLSGGVTPVNSYTGRVSDQDFERARQATLLQSENVPLQASQISSDPYLQTVTKYGGAAPGSGSPDFLQNQVQTYRNAALQRVEPGTNASLVTPQFVQNNDARIGTMYDNSVRAVPSVPSVDPATGLNIDESFRPIRASIPSGLTPDAQGQIHGVMNDVSDAFRTNGGQITGSDAQLLTRRTNSAIAPLLDSDNGVLRNYGTQIRNEVDTRLRSQMTPEQQATFDQANGQFRALRTVQNAADSDGSFEPKHLYGETQKATDQFGGTGTLDGIARAGNTVIQPTLDGRASLGPRITGTGTPLAAALLTGAAVKPMADFLVSGGAGTGVGLGLAAANRMAQAANRYGGPRAINTVLSGGGSPVMNIQNALNMLRVPAVSAALQRQQQPQNQ